MQSKILKSIVWAVALALVLVVAVFVYYQAVAHRNASDPVLVSELSGGAHSVEADAGGYRFIAPAGWRVELTGGESVAVYPLDKTTDASGTPQCKLELSVFENAGKTPLDAWLPVHLREDPTVTVVQNSLEARSVSGAAAVMWVGTFDGRKTVLVYILGDRKIYEIAPSSLDAADVTPDGCLGYLDEFLTKLQLSK
jgi:hypothetical protein